MKKTVMITIIIISMFLFSCSVDTKSPTYLGLGDYGINDPNFSIEKISYDEFIELDENEKIDGLVFVVRSTCDYCPYALQDFANSVKDITIAKDLYAIDSDDMTDDQKIDMVEKYGITSVPTIAVYNSGKLNSLEIGNIDEAAMEKIAKFISE